MIMEIMCLCIALGALICLLFMGVGIVIGRIDKRDNKSELSDDNDVRLYVLSRYRNRRGDK